MLVSSTAEHATQEVPMADPDEPVELAEYEVEVRPGVTTTMQLNDADAEAMGVKTASTDPDTKSRVSANKARGASENK